MFWPPWLPQLPPGRQHARGICFCESLERGKEGAGEAAPCQLESHHRGLVPHLGRAVSLGNLAMRAEPGPQSGATEAHREVERAVVDWHTEIWGAAPSSLPSSHVLPWEHSKLFPVCCHEDEWNRAGSSSPQQAPGSHSIRPSRLSPTQLLWEPSAAKNTGDPTGAAPNLPRPVRLRQGGRAILMWLMS